MTLTGSGREKKSKLTLTTGQTLSQISDDCQVAVKRKYVDPASTQDQGFTFEVVSEVSDDQEIIALRQELKTFKAESDARFKRHEKRFKTLEKQMGLLLTHLEVQAKSAQSLLDYLKPSPSAASTPSAPSD